MIKKLSNTTIWLFLAMVTLTWYACFPPDLGVDQPEIAEKYSSFEASVWVTTESKNVNREVTELTSKIGIDLPQELLSQDLANNNRDHNWLYFGIMLPQGWGVTDSIPFFGVDTGIFIYSDSLSAVMDTIDPAEQGYYWWVSETPEPVDTSSGTIEYFPEINTDGQSGNFYIDYMLGYNSELNECRNDDHYIGVGLVDTAWVTTSAESGPGSIRAAIDSVWPAGDICFTEPFTDTIFLTEQLVIYKDINIHGPENMPICISGGNVCRVLYINEGRNPHFSNLHVVRGNASLGGGIHCAPNSTLSLKNVKVSNNNADNGGGIYCDYNATVLFDSNQRCNIYQNTALWGKDIYTRSSIYLVVDTFTVLHPSEYHIFPRDEFTCDIINGKIEQVNADLYVSCNGNNSNSGLTTDDPLKTIDHAFYIIRADSLNQHVIHLLNGTFSTSINEEPFPIVVPDYVSISGESIAGVILDAEGQSAVMFIDNNLATSLEYFSVTRGLEGIFARGSNLKLQNLNITDNQIHGIYHTGGTLEIENVSITNNISDPNEGRGAGIQCMDATAIFRNSIISENECNYTGGGIYFEDINARMENVTISHNNAVYGGGICCHRTTFEFDSINRCNIYLNTANYGNDLQLNSIAHIILDTFSVLYPTEYHVNPLDQCTFDIFNGKIEQVDADLYVSPYGDDTNGGLTIDDPLKTIRHAMSKIIVNDDHHNTIRLLEGQYGPSTNDEIMPLTVPSYYRINGISANEVILDAEGQSGVMIIDHGEGITISDITITGGNADYGGGISSNGNITIQNVIIRNNTANAGGGMDFGGFLGGSNAILHNVLLTENVAYSRGGAIYSNGATLTFQNVTVSNNQSSRGKGIFCSNGSEIILRNSIFSENTDAIHFLDYNAENYITSYWSDVHGPIVTNSNGSFIWEEGSINEDPLFESTGDHPYALSLGSPCIDAGNPDTTGLNLPQWDVMGNQRIWDGDGNGTEIIDMGAYEFGAVPIGVEQLAVGSWQLAMKVFPNPASGIVNCQFGIVKYQRVIIKIYDLNGREVATVMDKMMPAGEHTVSFDAASLSAGVYVYKKTEVSSQKSEVGKLIKY